MEIIFDRCSSVDVHKETLTTCIMIGKGKRLKKEIRTYSTMTEDIENLRDWLKSEGIKKVAMESTGVYWKPVYNILEEGFEVILANARHIKNVPGRKTDVKDSEWLCMLLRNGLIRGSFIPPRHIRQLRDLTRHRRKLHHNISSEKNRLQKYLEDANIKLSSVATDIFGATGRDILRQIIKGNTNAYELSELARGVLKNKKDELKKSCTGRITGHHRIMIEFSLKHIEYMEGLIAEINSEIERVLQEHNLQESIDLLDSIPGVDQRASEDIIAEVGTQMEQFPTEDHLSSWAGMCPGNNESAGKKKVARPPKEING